VAARVREQTTRSEQHAGLLTQVGRRRREKDELLKRAAAVDVGIRAAVGMATLDADPPSDVHVAAAAGWSVEQVSELRAALIAAPAG
jgi:hypothetical protein